MTSVSSASLPPARPMIEQSGNYLFPAYIGGVIQKTAGSTTTLDAYNSAQDGNPYVVKNASSGDITVAASTGEWIQTASGNVATVTIPTDYAFMFIRNASVTTNWIIQ